MTAVSALTSEFDNSSIWSLDTADVVGHDGYLEIDLVNGTPYAISVSDYSLAGSSFSWRVTDYVQAASNQLSIELRVNGSASNMLRWQTNNATHFLRRYISGTLTTVASYAVTGSGAWQRIREASGVVYWEDSDDGVSWTQRASWTHGDALDLTSAVLEVRFQTNGPSATGSTMIVDLINAGRVRRWNGAAMVGASVKRWNGTAWVTAQVQRRGSSAWV